MSRTIEIQNFGPIRRATINLEKNFQIFIGAQASGKSTVCRVVYFCQKIKGYTLDFLMDSAQFTENHCNEYFNNYFKFMTGRFMGCFGKTTHMQKFFIKYKFNGKQIVIKLNTDGYVRFIFDNGLKEEIEALILETSEMYKQEWGDNKFASIIDNVTAMAFMKRQLQKKLNDLFEEQAEIIYIPAGRSLLATMSEQLHEFSVSDMDLTMQEFINLIRVTKSKFGNKIPEMIKNYTKTVKGQINNNAVEQAYALIKKILKADYTSESDGEKIYFDERHWVKLMYGSSGQQEALWILMLIFVTILENKCVYMIIEEPEAHLFPIAQKDMVNLIALMSNVTDSEVLLTTHSPYILTSLNILLFSAKVEKHTKSMGTAVIPRNMRVAYNMFDAYRVDENTEEGLISLMDEESNMISTQYIDEVSMITNSELDELFDMETRNNDL